MHLAVDVGGTFTDLVMAYEDGSVIGYKTPSTKPNIIQGFFNGIDLIAQANGIGSGEVFRRLKRIDFGTTAATNAVLEGKVARTALLVTQGFRDVLVVREEGRADTYDLKAEYPTPYIPRALTFEIGERMTAEGAVFRELDEASVLAAIARMREEKVEAVAISLLWSIANPAHELRVAEIVRQHLPDIAISMGHQVHPCLREYRRTTACALDASLKPLVELNLREMARRLSETEFTGKLTYISSSGGKASAEAIARRPVYLCFSGPSAAPESGRRFSRMEGIEHGNIITVDMGGTSFDVSIITDGLLPMHREGSIAGFPFGVPSVEIHTIGAGGGSIAHVDSGGFIHVGPESASSYPGPACYNRGGERATVTDCNLVSGLLSTTFSAGGGMSLSRELAEKAIAKDVAGPMDKSIEMAANLVTFACEQEMVAAIEELTIKRGIDPRDYVMVAGGAAAGTHAVSIAREMGIKSLIIPKMAGVLSAYGILTGDITLGFARSLATTTQNFDQAAVIEMVRQLAEEGTAFLDQMDVPQASRKLSFTCQAHYMGQVWELTLPIQPEELSRPDAPRLLSARFHELHRRLYQTAAENEDVEITEWNVLAIGNLPDVGLNDIGGEQTSIGPKGTRPVYFRDQAGIVDVPVYGPLALPLETPVRGPMLIDERLTTIFVGPDASVRLSRVGNYVVEFD